MGQVNWQEKKNLQGLTNNRCRLKTATQKKDTKKVGSAKTAVNRQSQEN